MMKSLLIIFLLISSVLFPSSCAAHDPVEITSFSLYGLQYTNISQFRMYLDYVNQTPDKTIEQAELTVEGEFAEDNTENKTVFRYFETDGIQSGAHNQEHIREVSRFKEKVTYTAYLSKVYFTDGSIWENTDHSGSVTASVWGVTATGESPLKLTEANFYRQYEGAESTEFNVNYINTSKEAIIIGTVFEIMLRNADGTLCKNNDGTDDVIYYPVFPTTLTYPGESNFDYHYTLTRYFSDNLSSASIYDIRPVRTITSDGRIWDSEETKPISCVMLGKKGYAFQNETNLKEINQLINALDNEFEQYGMHEGKPQIFLADHAYTVIRYKDCDIRAELDENNKVKNNSVAFSAYALQSDYLNPETKEKITNRIDNLYRCIFCTVLKEAPHDQMLKAVNEFLENDSEYLYLGDQTLRVMEDGGLIYNEQGELLINIISGTGSELNYDPTIQLLWAKDTIY